MIGRPTLASLLAVLCFVLSFNAIDLHAEDTWQAGAAETAITPAQLMWMAGYGGRDHIAEGKLTDLWAKALVLQDARGRKGVVITLDLVGIDRDLSQRICKSLKQRYDLNREQIAICTSHTHSGPVVGRNLPSLHYLLLDEEQGELYIRASKNLDSKAQSMRKRVNDSLAGKVLQTKRAIAIGNDSQWKRTHTALLVKSLIYVPLILQNKPIGVLGVTNRLKETSFDSNDTRALSALGGYATIAINNANIYTDIEQQRVTLSVVVDQIDDPVLVVDHEDKLLLLNQAARDVFELPDAKVVGHPINKLLKNQEAIEFILQDTGDEMQATTEIEGADGRSYQASMTFIEGGSRSILMVKKEDE